jgi:membrane-associated phospholipid phosphatase
MKLGRFEYNADWARLVSDVLSPPVVWATLAIPIALRDAPNQGEALAWAFVYILLVCLLPIVYIALMVKRGKITDIHMKVRGQRIRPFLISILCAGIAWAIFYMMDAPSLMPVFALFSLVQLLVMLIITLIWQISIHAISMSASTVALGVLFGTSPALMSAPLVVLVGAARIKLHRHTPAQVVVGTCVGVIIPLLLFQIVQW